MLVTCNNHHLTGKPEADGALIYIPPPSPPEPPPPPPPPPPPLSTGVLYVVNV